MEQRIIKNNTLFLSDCFDVFPDIADGSVDAIIADLPYGTTSCKWDTVLPLDKLWIEYKRIIKPNGAIVLFGSQPFTSVLTCSNLNWFKYALIWDKKSTTGFLNSRKMPLRRHEDILIFAKGVTTYNPAMEVRGTPRNKGSYNKKKGDGDMCYGAFKNVKTFNNEYFPVSIIEISNAAQKGKQHPTQKPVALMEYLIKTYTNEGETVLDNTMGSGSTGVACSNTGRRFIGIEKEKQYFDIAVKRITDNIGLF